MADAMMSWLLAIPLLGAATGLRSMTPMAVLCWYAWLGWLPVQGTWAEWTSLLWVAIVFTVLAVAEIVADKLPKVPNRTAPGPLLWRLVLGGLAGAIAATSLEGPGIEGVLLAVIGAILGTFGGFMVRRDLVQNIGCPDWPVAVGEDVLTIAIAGFAMHVVTS
jgi:uncharacterized membrane protein